jgi:hypothetical protein
MIDEADRDGDGEVSQDEFIRIMEKTNLFWNLCRFLGWLQGYRNFLSMNTTTSYWLPLAI